MTTEIRYIDFETLRKALTEVKRFVEDGKTSAQIARHFGVSRALVEFRIKISKLWDSYKRNTAKG